MTDPLDLWPDIDVEASKEHVICRYAAVTGSVIDALQVAYAVGRDLSKVIPGVDATEGAVIVAESLEADALLNSPAQALLTKPLDNLSDWTLAVLADSFLQVTRQMAERLSMLMKRRSRLWRTGTIGLSAITSSRPGARRANGITQKR